MLFSKIHLYALNFSLLKSRIYFSNYKSEEKDNTISSAIQKKKSVVISAPVIKIII